MYFLGELELAGNTWGSYQKHCLDGIALTYTCSIRWVNFHWDTFWQLLVVLPEGRHPFGSLTWLSCCLETTRLRKGPGDHKDPCSSLGFVHVQDAQTASPLLNQEKKHSNFSYMAVESRRATCLQWYPDTTKKCKRLPVLKLLFLSCSGDMNTLTVILNFEDTWVYICPCKQVVHCIVMPCDQNISNTNVLNCNTLVFLSYRIHLGQERRSRMKTSVILRQQKILRVHSLFWNTYILVIMCHFKLTLSASCPYDRAFCLSTFKKLNILQSKTHSVICRISLWALSWTSQFCSQFHTCTLS